MILKAHIDASQARIRAVVFFYMVDATNNISQPNGAIIVISTIMSNIMLSEAEA